ncbi:MAG: hypothetical protein UIC64_04320 [Agathobacter sp.]|nr:hypothetical protein [Agathobacter sp.]
MAEEDEILEDKKEKKKKEKKEKKEKKKKKKDEDQLLDEIEENESVGSKIVLGFVTLLMIVIWLAIIAVFIKYDVGGFGSTVMYPLLKDVPYLKEILPDNIEGLEIPESTEYQFDSIDDAIDRIKELEGQIAEMDGTNSSSADTIAELNAQIAELSVYKEEQAEFEEIKEKFYEEVVFGEGSPDIEEYKIYYESIDPENAEVLYKQVVEQVVYDEAVLEYANTYAQMKPKEAAKIFDTMEDDLELVAQILLNMDTQARANILGKMDAEIAAKVTEIMEPEE